MSEQSNRDLLLGIAPFSTRSEFQSAVLPVLLDRGMSYSRDEEFDVLEYRGEEQRALFTVYIAWDYQAAGIPTGPMSPDHRDVSIEFMTVSIMRSWDVEQAEEALKIVLGG